MGRVSALLATRPQQVARHQCGQQQVQGPLLQTMGHHPGTELGQHTVVEPGIGQVKTERVLPGQAFPDHVSGLPVGQVLHLLQHRHQCQPPRSPTRLAALTERRCELGVREQLAEPVTYRHRQRGLPLAAVHRPDRCSDLQGRLRPGLRLHRHVPLHPADRHPMTAAAP
jgi:hypothetical protein